MGSASAAGGSINGKKQRRLQNQRGREPLQRATAFSERVPNYAAAGNRRSLGDLGRRELSRGRCTWLRPPGLVFFPRSVNSQKGSEAFVWQRTGEKTFQNVFHCLCWCQSGPPPPGQSQSVSLEPGESGTSLFLLKRSNNEQGEKVLVTDSGLLYRSPSVPHPPAEKSMPFPVR